MPTLPKRSGILPTDAIPYTYNFWRGARRWRDSLGRVRTGKYGVDVIVLGDSTALYGDLYSAWPNRLKVLLQERFNNPEVQGGYGFTPFEQWGQASGGWNFVNTWNRVTGPTVGRPGAGLYEALASGSGRKIYRQWDGTSPSAKANRQQVTDWEFVGLDYPGVASEVFCVGVNGTGEQPNSNLVQCPGTSTWGNHWARQSGLTKTSNNVIQIGSSGTLAVWANGIIAYCDDYSEGVRLHNMSQSGTTTADWLQHHNASYKPESLRANVGHFCSGTNGGARNGKLILINSMLNDCGPLTESLDASAYKANLQEIITYAVPLGSKPCIGIIVNQPWHTSVANPSRLAAYTQYRDVCYQLADENSDSVFVVDFWRDLTDSVHHEYAPHGGNTAGGAMFDRGWYNDGTHPSDVGNFARAQMLFGVLSQGVG